ncbi:MAG TPA: protein kinase [Vicinamibacterales bacterium]|nr:protein kinase [Vicinamibacterales bacterium]
MDSDQPGRGPDDTGFNAIWSSDGVTRTLSSTDAALLADLPFLFSGGQRFGPYQIVRPLGKGGMGQVYEADEIDSGRRVAVKILSRGIGDDEERERFLREGQLAASLSHPNCVYVFGTSEIQGFPVIAMELVPEGTLRDRVVAGAPMAASAAVDAILQVIAGLEAAASIGILHRDIKPSNCFVHRDGRVLVGDFGLSVATAAHAPGDRAGTILGTPGFASPEQLRGDSLDVRSDIYSVGATLFYLLAGRAPFDDQSTTAIMARVATEPPPSLFAVRPGLPRRLALIVAKCLAKNAAERYESYAALQAALEPFGSARLAPAPIIRRFAAGLIDNYVTSLPAIPVVSYLALQPLSPSHHSHGLIVSVVVVITRIIYYGLLEGWRGVSVGKGLMGLRVVDADQVAPGVRLAAWRALLFALPSQAIVETITWLVVARAPDVSGGFLYTVTGLAYVAVLFCTARPSNGYLGVHDRWTRTRVVGRRVSIEGRARVERQHPSETAIAGDVRIGPYLLPEGAPTRVDTPVSLLGFDDKLRRRVWIDFLPPGTPALSAARRDLDRPARARWLAGRRDGPECWDAYEAVDGQPLRDLAATPQHWSRVRHWLDDLAREIAAGFADGTLPPLNPNCVWIGRDDRARLLEWTRPGAGVQDPPEPKAADLQSAQQLLYAVIVGALLGVAPDAARQLPPNTPLPLPARKTLLGLRDAAFASASALLDGISAALASPAHYPRGKRALQIAASAALPVLLTAVTVGGVVALSRRDAGSEKILALQACLDAIDNAAKALRKGPDPRAEQKQRDAEIYIAEHLSDAVRDPATWNRSVPNLGARAGRARARHALDAHPVRSVDDVRRADAAVSQLMDEQRSGLSRLSTWTGLWVLAIAISSGTFVITIVMSALGAAVTGSGFTFRPFGARLVNRRGQPASRVRALWRSGVTWTPVFATLALFTFTPKPPDYRPAILLLQTSLMLGMIAAAVWAAYHPSRSIQDRLSGTWIVPR